MQIDNVLFKKIQIVFWSLWWLIALWTDIVGGLTHIGVLHALWAPDTNYPFLLSSLKMYSTPVWLVNLFFIGIIAWSAIASGLFLYAALSLRQPIQVWRRSAQLAFIVSLAFWFAFFLADQLVMKFDLEENHMVQGGMQFLSFLSLYLLPNKTE